MEHNPFEMCIKILGGLCLECAAYMVVLDRVFFIRWDRELEEGVLVIWCSGVVTGPSMLTGWGRINTFRRILAQTGDSFSHITAIKTFKFELKGHSNDKGHVLYLNIP